MQDRKGCLERGRGTHINTFYHQSVNLLTCAHDITQVISAFHRRFPTTFTPSVVAALAAVLAPPARAALAAMAPEQREKEDATRVSRQRPVLRVCSELALVGIIHDGPKRSGGEWVMKTLKDLVGDVQISLLALLNSHLLAFERPLTLVTPTSLNFS